MLVPLIDRSQAAAILTLALSLVLALVMPLAYILCGAVAGFVTLRKGVSQGGIAVVGGLFGLGVVTASMGYPPGTGLMMPGCLLAASVVVAWSLDQTRSLAVAVWTATAVTLVGLLMFWVSLESPEAFWRGLFDEVVQATAQSGQSDLSQQLETMSAGMQWRGVTGLFFGSLFLMLITGLFWARSWQARLVNPQGFQQEFRLLKLGRALALMSALAFMGAAAAGLDLALSVAAVLLYVWLIPAFSLIHWLVARYQLGRGWIWAAYIICALTWIGSSTMFLLFPLAGMLNEYLDFRQPPGAGKPGEKPPQNE
ncbi:MAG: hypothetical protein AB8B96_11390 [Lysobacterales bacterium]